MIRYLLALQVLLFFHSSSGQEPYHFYLGEEELSGVDIYDLHQDQDLNYWIATNSGLFKFDGYTFEKVDCPGMLSSSLFNLVSRQDGDLYCNNLSGQIFRIHKGSCELYYQIPDSLMYRELCFNFDNLDRLTIITRDVFQLDENKELDLIIRRDTSNVMGELFKTKENELMVYDEKNGRFHSIVNGSLTTTATEKGNVLTRFMYLGDTLFGYDGRNFDLLRENKGRFEKIEGFSSEYKRFYCTDRNLFEVFLAGGSRLYDKGFDRITENVIFPSTIISTVMEDNEGNILIGTFGQGIIVIPDMSVLNVILPGEDKATKVVTSAGGDLFIGAQSGKVYKRSNGELELYISRGSKQVECLAYLVSLNALVVDNSIVRVIEENGKESKLEIGAIKDLYESADGGVFISSNMGIGELFIRSGKFVFEGNLDYNGRTNCVAYDPESNLIYAGTSQGLRIGSENVPEYAHLDGDPILSKDIMSHNGLVYVTSQNKGVLVFDGKELVDQWSTESGLPTNNIHEILTYKEQFVISTDVGIMFLDNEGNVERILNNSEGLAAKSPLDMEIHKNLLYVVHNKGLQQFNIDQLNGTPPPPSISLMATEVNNNQYINSQAKLSYNEDHLQFELKSPTLKYRGELIYEYKMSGIDEDWQYNSYAENVIEYKSLPAGDYDFQYRTNLRNKTSEIQHFSFSISRPFWNSWWFYALIFLFLLGIAFLIFRAQIRIQRRKARLQRELIGSKLTAIQSQMNPHFIFNSLNSIQDLVLRQEGESAYNYISKFAFLVRKVLQHSDAEFIELEEELKVLSVYLELEQLRFKKDFTFEINADEIDDVEIPPMLIQPFVENAIKHGLLHKKGPKKVSVKFKLLDDELHCMIKDNGIGRQRSAEIKARKSQQHESFSVKSIRSRFDILKSKYGGTLGVKFEDLQEGEEPAGTKVDLRIPFRRKF